MFVKSLAGAALGALILALSFTEAPAQPPPPPGQPGQPMAIDPNDDAIEVLARGPVHEAYAGTIEQPTPTDIVAKAPPEPIEELPPEQRPEGDNVQWIPGYWHWDVEREDFIWVSGFWRIPPPGHVWVPGSWQQVADGFQWVPGFWQAIVPEQPVQPEIVYLPPPPQTIEVGPTVPAPDETSVYVPGCWIWRDRYVWRPGFWIPYQPGWVWIPAHYRWTPIGCIFIDGYWDHPLDTRGVLFTPVHFHPRAFARPGFAFTPRYMIARQLLLGALFHRRGYSNYYFGDYYDPLYVKRGFYPWNTPLIRDNVDLGLGRRYFYDPIWSYYSVAHRGDPRWARGVNDLYVGRYRGDIPRPPRTLVQQNQVIQKITNVTDVTNITQNITVVNGDIRVANKDVTPVMMVAPLQVAPKLQPQARIQPITQQVRVQEAKVARQFRDTGIARRKSEAAILRERPPGKADPTVPGQQPRPQPVAEPTTVRLQVPEAAVKSAAIKPKQKGPPPPPQQPKVDPKTQPKKGIDPEAPMPMPKFDPKEPKGKQPMPKFDPKEPKGKQPMPKFDPKEPKGKQPKIDPKQPIPEPKVEPKQPVPKVEPKQPLPEPKGKGKQPFPKVEPKGKAPQPKGEPKFPSPQPKTEPMLPTPQPKTEPKFPMPKVDPRFPTPQPKVEPKQPRPLPKAEPKLPTPQPKVEPKQPVPLPAPKVEPKQPFPQPKAEPRPPGPLPQPKQPFPKVEPKQKGPPPKIEPKLPPTPPRVEPPQAPRVDPVPPPMAPRVEPKGGPPPKPKGEPGGKGKGKEKSDPPGKNRNR